MAIAVSLPFTTPANYVVDGSEVAGGECSLVNLRPADLEFVAEYADGTPNARISPASPTGTLVNGAIITGSTLDLRGGASTTRCDYSADVSNALIGDVGTIRLRYIPNYSGNPAADRYLFGCGVAAGNVNRVDCYHRAGGGADDRILFLMYDGLGASIIGGVTYLLAATAGEEIELEFNWDLTLGEFRAFRNGVLGFSNLALPAGTRTGTNDRFRVGNSRSGSNAPNGQISSFAIFDTVQHVADYTPNAIGVECVPPDYDVGTVITAASWDAEALEAFAVTDDQAGGSIGYGLELDGGLTWWDGAAWSASDGSLAELNTAADILANLGALDLAPATAVKVFARLESTDGTGTPSIDEIVFDYDFGSVVPPDSTLCEVFGFVRTMDGTPVEGATVTAEALNPGGYIESTDPAVIAGRVKAVTDADGRFDLDVIQGLTVRIKIRAARGEIVRYVDGTATPLEFVVPALDFVDITSLL